jgi:hypothetical protein
MLCSCISRLPEGMTLLLHKTALWQGFGANLEVD